MPPKWIMTVRPMGSRASIATVLVIDEGAQILKIGREVYSRLGEGEALRRGGAPSVAVGSTEGHRLTALQPMGAAPRRDSRSQTNSVLVYPGGQA